jgi:hypothetical protein
MHQAILADWDFIEFAQVHKTVYIAKNIWLIILYHIRTYIGNNEENELYLLTQHANTRTNTSVLILIFFYQHSEEPHE